MKGWAEHRSGDIQYLAHATTATRRQLDARIALFRETHPAFNDIWLVDRAGIVYFSLLPPARLDVSDTTYFRNAREGKETYCSLQPGGQDETSVVLFVHPYADAHGDFDGAVVGVILATTLLDTFNIAPTASAEALYLVDSASHSVPGSNTTPAPSTLPRVRTAETPHATYAGPNGQMMLGVALPVFDNWLAIREMTLESVLAPMHQALLALVAISGITLLALAPLLLRFVRGISRPVVAMSAMSTRMLAGEYSNVCERIDTAGVPTELAQLYRNFCDMAWRTAEYLHQLEVFTSTDTLTGLNNRHSMETSASLIFEKCQRPGSQCACLVLDLDHFKRINDTYGHLAGDATLQAFGKILRAYSRKTDFVVRMGGEEFVIICTDITPENTSYLAERIRTAVEQSPLVHDGRTFHITVSIGIALMDPDSPTAPNRLEDLLDRADGALYKAKSEGRNRIVTWQASNAKRAG